MSCFLMQYVWFITIMARQPNTTNGERFAQFKLICFKLFSLNWDKKKIYKVCCFYYYIVKVTIFVWHIEKIHNAKRIFWLMAELSVLVWKMAVNCCSSFFLLYLLMQNFGISVVDCLVWREIHISFPELGDPVPTVNNLSSSLSFSALILVSRFSFLQSIRRIIFYHNPLNMGVKWKRSTSKIR